VRRLLASFAVLLLVPAAADAASERRLTAEPTAGEVAAYGGKVVWSRRVDVGFDLEYRLVETTPAGPRDLPVAQSREPFQLDIGPGADGAPVAVYVRCAEGTYCDIYRYDFARRQESRVAGVSGPRCSATEPAIWRGRIVFIRQNFFTAGCVSGLYLREPTGKVTRLLREPPDFKAAVYQPDLRGGWVTYAASGDYSTISQIHVMRLRDRDSRRVTQATGEIALYPLPGPVPPDRPLGTGFSVSAPRLLGRFVYWVRWDISHNIRKIGRALRLRTGKQQYAALPQGATMSGDHVYVDDGHGLVERPLPPFSRR
jgi:hypothetical protein